MPKLNPALAGVALPPRIAALPVADSGFPVPWFVALVDGAPEFRAMDGRKRLLAVKEKRCWVCGGVMTRLMTFVIGPMCAVNRTTAEPPCHTGCARFAARYCPFLSRPHMTRRDGDIPGEATRPGHMIARNPGVAALWTTRRYSLVPDGRGDFLFDVGTPEAVEWWCEGRPATRGEVLESVRTGLPGLEALAAQEDGAPEELARLVAAAERFYPAA